jgi:ribonucleoside-diphosphate reductase alpha chain
MIAKTIIEEDLQLKELSRTTTSKPRYDWSKELDNAPQRSWTIANNDGETEVLTKADVAEMIGNALTILLVARQQEDIYNEKNKQLVNMLANAVTHELNHQGGSERPEVAHLEVARAIERALVRNNAYDLALSFVNCYSQDPYTGTQANLALNAHGVIGNGAGIQATPPAKPFCRVMRRNGDLVPWNEYKINVAVRKAFLSQSLDSSPASEVAQGVTKRVRESGRQTIDMEQLQDLVQEELMRQGHYKVAASYILYRNYREDQRLQQAAARQNQTVDTDPALFLLIKGDAGETITWDGSDLRKRIDFSRRGLDLCLSVDEIDLELRRSIFENISIDDLHRTLQLNAKTLIDKDADFAKFAGRFLLTFVYEEVLGWSITRDGIETLAEFHRKGFRLNLQRGVDIHRINPQLLEMDLDRLALAIDPFADMELDYLGVQTLYDRYLIVDKMAKKHRRLETPQYFFMRVAMGLFIAEKDRSKQTEHITQLYTMYKSRRFCSSTPTLFNSGTLHSQLSSCYLYKVDDSIESIMVRGIAENAFLSKWAGGLGGSWTSVRGTGGYIKGTNGESQGVIPFLKLHNDQLIAVNQGGKRRGSGCAYLETWHNDITDFLELRKNVGDERRRTHDMNTANWIPDLFMKRWKARQDWTLFRSNEVPDLHDLYGRAFERRYEEYEAKAERGEIWSKKVPALDLWKEMLKAIFETGHPWITFKDPCNLRSPQDHTGVIHSSNLCTEITLNTSDQETAVCNLGSIVIENHLTEDGQIDHEKLRATIRIAVRALDNVIDINFYPTEAARTANSRHRPIGLGVMGLANALYQKNVSFASQEGVEFNDEIMEAVAFYAYEASSDLAAELGQYSSFRGSKWDRGILPQDTLELLERERGMAVEVPRGGKLDWAPIREKIRTQGMRNSNVLAIAPTATISNIVGSTPCIEPTFKNLFVKSNLSGDFMVLNTYLVKDLKALGLWDDTKAELLKYHEGELDPIEEIPAHLKEKYKTAFRIDSTWVLQAASRRQKWIDQSQSLNLWYDGTDLVALSKIYYEAWSRGLKTTYYLRTMAASSIEKATIDMKKEARSSTDKRVFTPEEKQACSIEAMRNGETCEACQ